jgi:tetratricopeptide (TPR) repeat protein
MAGVDLAALWDFTQPAASEQRFRSALAAAEGADALVLRTQLARSLGLQRRFDEAAVELDRVASSTELTPLVKTHLDLERGRLLNSSGNREASKDHFLQALAEADAAGIAHLAADAAHMMAIVAPRQEQVGWAQRALEIAEASEDPRARKWVGSVTHNLGWTMHDLGRYDEALGYFEQALAFREQQGDPEPIRVGRWTVARALRSLNRYDEALAIQRTLAETGPSDGYVFEELGELLLAKGQQEQARPHFARAYALLSQDEWLAEAEPDRLRRLADLAQPESS